MRCPKCSYISFDKVTSCIKCSTDVTEVAHALNGTAFRPLGTFYLGTLLPDYAAAFVQDQGAGDYAFDSGDDLEISVDSFEDFGSVPDVPGDISEEDFSLAADDFSEFDGEDISLEDHDMPDMDLTGFGEDHTGFKSQAGASVEPEPAPEVAEESVADVGFDDVPEFDLSGIDFEDNVEADADLELEDGTSTPDLSDIDLSLGEDELEMAGEEEEMPSFGDLEMDAENGKDKGIDELPDLEL